MQEVALADLNGVGSLDAYLTINPDGEPYIHPDYVLFNEGTGQFVDGGQELGNTNSFSIALADLNGDGAVDLFSGDETEGQVWLSDSRGRFSRTGQEIGYEEHDGLALGDVTGDGVVDIFI